MFFKWRSGLSPKQRLGALVDGIVEHFSSKWTVVIRSGLENSRVVSFITLERKERNMLDLDEQVED